MKLKLFSDRRYLPKQMPPDPILLPFWTDFLEDEQHPWLRSYSRYAAIGKQFFEMVPLEEADLAVLPANWRTIRGDSWRSKIDQAAQDLSLEFADRVQQAKKPLVIFFSGDCSDEELPIDEAIVFRMSAYRSRLKPNNFVPPASCDDLIAQYSQNHLPIREKAAKARVGFCGFVRADSWKRKLQTVAYHGTMLATQFKMGVSPYRGQILRSQAIHVLQNSSVIETNFILRSHSFFDPTDTNSKQARRAEYVSNLLESDYALCCRGSANYSIRLFEILCCGRIPVLIDTDCVLPFESEIDWKQYCVWVDERELDQLPEKIAEFHNRLSPQDFINLQYECRQLWKDWLSSEGFYANFYHHFDNRAKHSSRKLSPRCSKF